jgi:hypothetical protein
LQVNKRAGVSLERKPDMGRPVGFEGRNYFIIINI